MEKQCCHKRDTGRDIQKKKKKVYSLYLSFPHLFTKSWSTPQNLRHKFFNSEPAANSVNILLCLRDSKSTFISITELMPFIEPEDFPIKYRALSVHPHLPEPSLYSCSQHICAWQLLAKETTCQITESICLQGQDIVPWEVMYQILK